MLTWNGEEVTGEISDIILRDNAGGVADTLAVQFPDPERSYQSWQPKKGDVLTATFGGWSSGAMFFDGYTSVDRAFAACAVSTPAMGREEAHRRWDNALFTHIAGDVAAACGLTLRFMGAEDYRYDAVAQAGTGNLRFLQWLCEREGWQLKVHDGMALILNEKELENMAPSLTVDLADMGGDYRFGSLAVDLKGSCAVSWRTNRGYLTHMEIAQGIVGGRLMPDIRAASAAEAQRFARAALRRANRDEYAGSFGVPLNPGIAAGSTISLTGMGAFAGMWYLTMVEHRIITGRTLCRCRRSIEGVY